MVKLKKNKGITLIALVITIVVLLILATVTIAQLSNSGLFNKTQVAKETYTFESEQEQLEIEIANLKMQMLANSESEISLNNLKEYLESNKFEGEYIVELFYEPLATTEEVQAIPLYAKVTHVPTQFVFYIDGRLVVVGGESNATVADNANINGNRDEISKVINDFEIEVYQVEATACKIRINTISTSDNTEIKGYVYFLENKVKRVSESNDITISGLVKDTPYGNIYVMAIDENGKLKKSSNTETIRTKASCYAEWKGTLNKTGTYETALVKNDGFESSGNTITIDSTGTYKIDYAWWTKGWTNGAHALYIYKNGTKIHTLNPTNNATATGTLTFQFTEGDVIKIQQYTDNGPNYPTSGDVLLYNDTAPYAVSI